MILQITGYTLTFGIQLVNVKTHPRMKKRMRRISQHVIIYFVIIDVIGNVFHDIRLTRKDTIPCFQPVILLMFRKFHTGSHISHVLHGLFNLLAGFFGQFRIINPGSLPDLAQKTVHPLG